jgi:hypothetical protein
MRKEGYKKLAKYWQKTAKHNFENNSCIGRFNL